MKIGSQWDRISKCYVTNYEEIIDKGLPFFELIRKRAFSQNIYYSAISIFFYQ